MVDALFKILLAAAAVIVVWGIVWKCTTRPAPTEDKKKEEERHARMTVIDALETGEVLAPGSFLGRYEIPGNAPAIIIIAPTSITVSVKLDETILLQKSIDPDTGLVVRLEMYSTYTALADGEHILRVDVCDEYDEAVPVWSARFETHFLEGKV